MKPRVTALLVAASLLAGCGGVVDDSPQPAATPSATTGTPGVADTGVAPVPQPSPTCIPVDQAADVLRARGLSAIDAGYAFRLKPLAAPGFCGQVRITMAWFKITVDSGSTYSAENLYKVSGAYPTVADGEREVKGDDMKSLCANTLAVAYTGDQPIDYELPSFDVIGAKGVMRLTDVSGRIAAATYMTYRPNARIKCDGAA